MDALFHEEEFYGGEGACKTHTEWTEMGQGELSCFEELKGL